MSDLTQDLEVTEHDAAETETEATAESERTFTQAEVEALIKQRLDRDRRDRKSRTQKPKPRAKAQPKQEAEPAQELDSGAVRDLFYDAIHGRDFKLQHIKKMRAEFLASPPSDPDAWVDEWAELLGLTADAEADEADAEVDDKPQAKAEPVSDKPVAARGAPQRIQDYDTVVDPNRLDADDIRRMVAKYGERQAHKRIREMVEKHYRGRDIRK